MRNYALGLAVASLVAGCCAAGTGLASAATAAAGEPTITRVALSAAKVSYGAEQHERVSVSVKAGDGGIPAGRVAVKAGSKVIREITLKDGKGSVTLPAAGLAAGAPRLTLAYPGDARYAASAAAVKLTVAKAPSRTTFALSATTLPFGAGRHERVTVAVWPGYAGTATGRVTVTAGGVAICAVTLKSGRGSCSPAAARLSAGWHQVAAVYHGDRDLRGSVSAARAVTVAKAAAAVALSLAKSKVQYGSEGSERITVRVAPRYAGTPGGTVTVSAGGSVLAVIRLRSGTGSYAFGAKRLAAGSYQLVASYGGSADFTGATSATEELTVTSPPPPSAPPTPPAPTPACYPLSDEGTCYEPGEYCRDSDHGTTGIAGDGQPIICEDNDGWRWEPY